MAATALYDAVASPSLWPYIGGIAAYFWCTDAPLICVAWPALSRLRSPIMARALCGLKGLPRREPTGADRTATEAPGFALHATNSNPYPGPEEAKSRCIKESSLPRGKVSRRHPSASPFRHRPGRHPPLTDPTVSLLSTMCRLLAPSAIAAVG